MMLQVSLIFFVYFVPAKFYQYQGNGRGCNFEICYQVNFVDEPFGASPGHYRWIWYQKYNRKKRTARQKQSYRSHGSQVHYGDDDDYEEAEQYQDGNTSQKKARQGQSENTEVGEKKISKTVQSSGQKRNSVQVKKTQESVVVWESRGARGKKVSFRGSGKCSYGGVNGDGKCEDEWIECVGDDCKHSKRTKKGLGTSNGISHSTSVGCDGEDCFIDSKTDLEEVQQEEEEEEEEEEEYDDFWK